MEKGRSCVLAATRAGQPGENSAIWGIKGMGYCCNLSKSIRCVTTENPCNQSLNSQNPKEEEEKKGNP